MASPLYIIAFHRGSSVATALTRRQTNERPPIVILIDESRGTAEAIRRLYIRGPPRTALPNEVESAELASLRRSAAHIANFERHLLLRSRAQMAAPTSPVERYLML